MMRILVLGASGMLGHRLVRGLSNDFDVVAAMRSSHTVETAGIHFANARIVTGIDAFDFSTVETVVVDAKPDVVINAIGAIKQIDEGKSAVSAITVNSLFPHKVAELASAISARVINFGTDCVFSGTPGPHREDDVPDAKDIYGRSKLLGEVGGPNCLTLRTSIIGRELRGGQSLIEWFLAQNGKKVRGFRRALYTGMTTGAMTNLIRTIVHDKPELCGTWQVAGPQINKYDLLVLVRDSMRLQIEIEPYDGFVCDRRLDGSRFSDATGLCVPSWPHMIRELADETDLYEPVASP